MDDAIRALAANRPEAEGYLDEASLPLNRLRLLIALDALMVEGSVGRAAARMGLGTPAMSRLLKQIRDLYGDPILVRTARGMVPTPFAETLRLRLRALAAEAQDLLEPSLPGAGPAGADRGWPGNRRPIVEAPPLALRGAAPPEGGPGPAAFARKLAAIGPRAEPRQRLARAIATIGAGTGRSRALSTEESEDALGIVLSGEADPVQIGAFLVAFQHRGVTASELAGLAAAARARAGALPTGGSVADLDWPVYLSPKSRFEPWFLLAARLVGRTGARVLLHGFGRDREGHDRLGAACARLGIPAAASLDAAGRALDRGGIVFLPIEAFAPKLRDLLGLYQLLEMRSPLSHVVHLLDPLGARASLLGAAPSAHRTLHRDAARILGCLNIGILPHTRDVAEARPNRAALIQRLVAGRPTELRLPAMPIERLDLPSGMSAADYLEAVWHRQAMDAYPRRVVLDTAALALTVLREEEAPGALISLRDEIEALWR